MTEDQTNHPPSTPANTIPAEYTVSARPSDDGEAALPYRIAVLCYLFDKEDRVLLLHRAKPPNFDLYSPIGGKLEVTIGESPTTCALREIEEEAAVTLQPDDLSLVGIISERSFEGSGHWLLFCFEVTKPVEVKPGQYDEGTLEWHNPDEITNLNIPNTDRELIWPLFFQHRGGGFFMVHIECTENGISWVVDESRPPA